MDDFDTLNSKFGHSLYVNRGSIKYEDRAFVLAENTAMQYNLTTQFPKRNIAITMRVNTLASDVTIDLGGFH
jgi:hypothetical protein